MINKMVHMKILNHKRARGRAYVESNLLAEIDIKEMERKKKWAESLHQLIELNELNKPIKNRKEQITDPLEK